MSFTLCAFNLVIYLAVAAFKKQDCAAVIHDGLWTLKIIAVGALFTASFWIPNDPIGTYYLHLSRFVSVLFLAY